MTGKHYISLRGGSITQSFRRECDMTAKRGFFRSALDALIAAREKQAEAYVSRALLGFDDKTLKAYGYDRAELARRAGPSYPF
jgi:hypothetical protein